MDIRVLNYFLITAREENITKAASLLNLTQPTLSRQLKGLETELNVELFHRSNHSIYLTKEGLLFRQRAQDIVNIFEHTRDELQSTEELIGTIEIGCGELHSTAELAQLLDEFQELYPKVKFNLRSGNNNDIKGWIEQGVLDMGLLIEPVEIGKYDFVHMNSKEEWGILAHKKSKFSEFDAIRPGDLVGTKVITISDRIVQNELGNWSGKYAIQMENKARYNLLYSAAMLAQQNHGVVICLKTGQHFDDLKYIPLEPKLELNSVLAWRGQQPHSEATKAFIDFIRKEKN
ncbi:LysR family transcriptional regulator [Companilactobacillus baiquanensis]|uniref:LysR family transcriptional regulator n=1 Tax=Companilactobacillus baiquanensis TaxID=2486005 RepID=A0ABW1UXV8_9LACO|nr:LysR family transcriptional regulator [Companilactobacillus baiquanensis]